MVVVAAAGDVLHGHLQLLLPLLSLLLFGRVLKRNCDVSGDASGGRHTAAAVVIVVMNGGDGSDGGDGVVTAVMVVIAVVIVVGLPPSLSANREP